MGYAFDLVNNFKVENVIFNCGEFIELEQDLINVLDKKKMPYYSCVSKLYLDDTRIYRTDQNGSIIFKIKNNRINIETYLP